MKFILICILVFSSPFAHADTALAEMLKADISVRQKCENVGDIANIRVVDKGNYAANGKPYQTIQFSAKLLCREGSPGQEFRARLDYQGRVRFTVPVENTASPAPISNPLQEAIRQDIARRNNCNDVGEIGPLQTVAKGTYAANGREHTTYQFSVQLNCKPGKPTQTFRARVDYRGAVRFTVLAE